MGFITMKNHHLGNIFGFFPSIEESQIQVDVSDQNPGFSDIVGK